MREKSYILIRRAKNVKLAMGWELQVKVLVNVEYFSLVDEMNSRLTNVSNTRQVISLSDQRVETHSVGCEIGA